MGRNQSGGRGGGNRGNSGGRGGRGNQNRSRNNSSRRDSEKQKDYKFMPHSAGKQTQSMTYDTVKDHVVQVIQRTYRRGQDIAKALREMEKLDLSPEVPSRAMSTETDEDIRRVQQEGLDILYKAEVQQYMERKCILEENMAKAYALIFSSYCNKTMQHRVEEHPKFDDEIRDNPIELLKAIKVLMHDPIRSRYPYASMTDALSRLLTTKQQENEGLMDYVKRFKQQRDVVKSHLGSRFLDTFIAQTQEYRDASKASEKAKMKQEAVTVWYAYLLMRQSDQLKYGSLTRGMVTQFSMKNDQFPKSVQDATDILSSHRFDAGWNKNQKNKKNQNQNSSNS